MESFLMQQTCLLHQKHFFLFMVRTAKVVAWEFNCKHLRLVRQHVFVKGYSGFSTEFFCCYQQAYLKSSAPDDITVPSVMVFQKDRLMEKLGIAGFSGVMCHVSISPDRNNAQGWNTFSYKEE